MYGLQNIKEFQFDKTLSSAEKHPKDIIWIGTTETAAASAATLEALFTKPKKYLSPPVMTHENDSPVICFLLFWITQNFKGGGNFFEFCFSRSITLIFI